jgi:F420H2 dehydrogenase subunit N
MYMEDAPDMRRVKEPRAIVAVLIFAIVFMVGFGIWHAPLLDFASKAVPDLASNITQASMLTGGTH